MAIEMPRYNQLTLMSIVTLFPQLIFQIVYLRAAFQGHEVYHCKPSLTLTRPFYRAILLYNKHSYMCIYFMDHELLILPCVIVEIARLVKRS